MYCIGVQNIRQQSDNNSDFGGLMLLRFAFKLPNVNLCVLLQQVSVFVSRCNASNIHIYIDVCLVCLVNVYT